MATTLSVLLKMTDQVSDKFKEISNSGQTAVDALKGVQETADAAFERVSEGTSEATRAMQDATGAASTFNNEMANVNSVTEEAGEAADGYASSADEAAEALNEASTGAEEAAESVEKFGEEAEESGNKTDEFGKKGTDAIQAVQTIIVAAGIAKLVSEITDAFDECTEAAKQFETSGAMLSTIAGKENLAGLKNEIAQVSRQSGAAQKDLAEVAYNAISAGTAVEDSVEMAATASKLAAAGFTDEASSLRILTTAINAYGDSAGTAEEISDSLVMVQNLGVTTVAQLSQQMGKSIATAAAFNVSLGNLESAYISTTKAGIATAESTTYISGMISELGKDSADVAKTLQENTGKTFGQLMEDGNSLADVLAILYEEAGRDTEVFANMWGSQTAAKAALAIINQGLDTFNENLVAVTSSVGATQQAYEIMADTGEVVDKKLNTAVENLKIAIGDDLMPVVNDFKRTGTDIINDITDFVNDNPEIVAAIAAITGGLTIFVGTLGTTIAAIKLVNLGLEAMGVSSTIALGPIGLVVAAVAGLTTAGILMHDMIKANYEVEEELTYSSQRQAEKIEELNVRYDEAVEKYGETSEQALRLKNQLDDLNAAYDTNKQTVDQVIAKSESLRQQIDQNIESYKQEQSEIQENATKGLLMAQRLKDLAQYGHGTNAEFEEMKVLIEALNSEYEDYNETLSRVMSTAGHSTEQVIQLAEAEAERRANQSKIDNYVNTLVEQNSALEYQKELEADLKLKQEELNEASKAWDDMYHLINMDGSNMFAALSMYWSDEQMNLELAQENYDKVKEELDAVNETVKNNNAVLEEQRAAFEQVGEAAEEASTVEISSQEQAEQAVTQVAESLQEQAEALADAYNKAHESVRNAISGTFGIFEEVKLESEQTAEGMLKALESQSKYLDDYKQNIEDAKNMGLSEELLTAFSDGSKQSAESLQTITDHVRDLGEGSQAAKDYIKNLNDEFTKVVEAKGTLENTLIEMNGTLKDKTDEMVKTMSDAVDAMELDDEAAAAAKATLEAYAKAIENNSQGSIDAANACKNAVASALAEAKSKLEDLMNVAKQANDTANSIKTNPNNPSQTTEASGTTFSPSTFIAGEAGAELIINRPGSEVFPASETAKIIRAVREYDTSRPAVPTEVKEITTSSQTITSRSKKDINLNINGSGGFNLGDGGITLQAVETYMLDNIRPVLLQLLSQEAMEEGDAAYEF